MSNRSTLFVRIWVAKTTSIEHSSKKVDRYPVLGVSLRPHFFDARVMECSLVHQQWPLRDISDFYRVKCSFVNCYLQWVFNCVVSSRQIASVILFWKKVVILISFLFTAKRSLMMSSSPSRSGSRSRSSSRSRAPMRRRSPRSRSPSGSGREGYGGSGQDNRRGSSRSRSIMYRARRRSSRSEDLDTPRRHTSNWRATLSCATCSTTWSCGASVSPRLST